MALGYRAVYTFQVLADLDQLRGFNKDPKLSVKRPLSSNFTVLVGVELLVFRVHLVYRRLLPVGHDRHWED